MDLTQYGLIALALAGGAISKGATGMGLPLIALPVIATTLGLPHAIAVMVIPILVTNAWQVWLFRATLRGAALTFLPPMVLGCALGVVVGTWVLTTLPERTLSLALGLLLMGYLLLRVLRPGAAIGPEWARRAAAPVGFCTGVLQGAAGISAPVGVTFIHAMRLGWQPHVAAVSAMFLAMAVVQLPALTLAGLVTGERLLQGIFALLPTLLFMPVGQWLGRRMSVMVFDRAILLFLGVIGLNLVFDL